MGGNPDSVYYGMIGGTKMGKGLLLGEKHQTIKKVTFVDQGNENLHENENHQQVSRKYPNSVSKDQGGNFAGGRNTLKKKNKGGENRKNGEVVDLIAARSQEERNRGESHESVSRP